MKTVIKNKRSYRKKIGRLSTFNARESESVTQEESSGSRSLDIASDDDEANNGEDIGDFSNSDEDEDEDEDSVKGSNSDMEEESGNSAGPAGTKRKAMESIGKGKQRKV